MHVWRYASTKGAQGRDAPMQEAYMKNFREYAGHRERLLQGRADDVGHQDRGQGAFESRLRRYAAATVSAVSGRPGKASRRHRKDARGMSMAVLPCGR